jgi:peptide chain release factor subunit 1
MSYQVMSQLRAEGAALFVHAGGENGFSQAIELASDTLANVKFVQEKRLISKFFDEISQDTGKYGFGISETLQLMEMGAVETLVVWEELEVDRVTLKNTASGDEVIKFLTPEQLKKSESFRCAAAGSMAAKRRVNSAMATGNAPLTFVRVGGLSRPGSWWAWLHSCIDAVVSTPPPPLRRDKEGNELESVESVPLLSWLAENYKRFGCVMEFVTDRSQEGSQFCKGFGGIGGLLRYAVPLAELEGPDEDFGDMWDEDEW